MKIAVIGAGPAGLYFSLLMKKDNPQHEIHIYEQNAADATYGWGVVFSDVALSFIRDADPEFYEEFTAHHFKCDRMEIVHQGVHVPLMGNRFSCTPRITLLQVLREKCAAEGVQIHYDTRIDSLQKLPQADLVVAADGVNSQVRTLLAEQFGTTREERRNKFAWYGTAREFPSVSLIFRENADGLFIAHAYQYGKNRSTFLVEVDPEAWKRAGLDQMSEAESCAYCENVFAEDLQGQPLLSNRSTWFQANIVRNQRWSSGNIVLLGDALRTIHFSLGSGTRMAMQDAIALYQACVLHGNDVDAALAHFSSLRGEATTAFQDAAARSLDWYENVGTKRDLDPVSFAYDYMRRTGRVSHDELRRRDPELVARYEAIHGDAIA
jgi:anthraniloyl-CoA monooxygenase